MLLHSPAAATPPSQQLPTWMAPWIHCEAEATSAYTPGVFSAQPSPQDVTPTDRSPAGPAGLLQMTGPPESPWHVSVFFSTRPGDLGEGKEGGDTTIAAQVQCRPPCAATPWLERAGGACSCSAPLAGSPHASAPAQNWFDHGSSTSKYEAHSLSGIISIEACSTAAVARGG